MAFQNTKKTFFIDGSLAKWLGQRIANAICNNKIVGNSD
jgi:hypothetical protein